MNRENEKAIQTSTTEKPKRTLRDIADRAFRFIAGINLQDHSVKDQREQLEVVRELKYELQPNAEARRVCASAGTALAVTGAIEAHQRVVDDVLIGEKIRGMEPPRDAPQQGNSHEVMRDLADVIQKGLQNIGLPMYRVRVVSRHLEVCYEPPGQGLSWKQIEDLAGR